MSAGDFSGPMGAYIHLFRASDPGLALLKGLSGRSGCIDDRPFDRADIIFLLKLGNLGRSVGCIELAATDAVQSGRKVRYEKEADKPDIQLARGILDRDSLHFIRKHRVDDDAMALRKNPQRALHKNLVNVLSDLRLVCAFRQPIGFIDLK